MGGRGNSSRVRLETMARDEGGGMQVRDKEEEKKINQCEIQGRGNRKRDKLEREGQRKALDG